MGRITARAFLGLVVTISAIGVSYGRLELQQRLADHRAVEEVYWRHRIWPEQNPGPKPPMAEPTSSAAPFDRSNARLVVRGTARRSIRSIGGAASVTSSASGGRNSGSERSFSLGFSPSVTSDLSPCRLPLASAGT